MNIVILHGNIGQDPTLRYTRTQIPVTNLSVATHHMRNEEQVTCWHNVTVFGGEALLASKHLRKGDAVIVHGRLEDHRYRPRDATEDIVRKVVIANRVEWPKGRRAGGSAEAFDHAESTHRGPGAQGTRGRVETGFSPRPPSAKLPTGW